MLGAAGRRTARKVSRNTPIELLARFGLACYGAVHLLIALLATRVAFGDGGTIDKSGALALIAQRPGGRVLLWVISIGLAALTLWQASEAVWRSTSWLYRAGHLAKALLFAALGAGLGEAG